VEIHYYPVFDSGGNVIQAVVYNNDITERKQIEQELHNSNELLENIFCSTHFQLVYLDREFNITRVNDAYAGRAHRPKDYFTGKNHFRLYPDKENEEIFQRVVDTGEPFSVRAKPYTYPDQPEPSLTYRDWTLLPVKDAGGRVRGLVLSLYDVTEHKLAEQSLRESARRFTLFMEHLPGMA